MPPGDRWRDADATEALKLQRPVPDDAEDIVARDEKEDRGSPQRSCSAAVRAVHLGLVPVQDTRKWAGQRKFDNHGTTARLRHKRSSTAQSSNRLPSMGSGLSASGLAPFDSGPEAWPLINASGV